MKNKRVLVLGIALIAVIGTAFASTGGSTPSQETIVFLGASITAGTSATVIGKDDKSKSPPAFFQKYVNIPVINISGGDGRGTTKILSLVKKEVLPHNPRIVVIGEGVTNDIRGAQKVSLATSRNNLQKIIDMVNDGKRKIYLVRDFSPVTTVQHLDMFSTLASSNNIELIDGVMDGVGNNLSGDQYGHPNAKGYEIIADNYFEAMAPYLKANNLLSDAGTAKAWQTPTGIKYNWDFGNPASGTAGWSMFPDDADFHGTADVSRDDKTFGKGMLRVDIDYSKDSKSWWSEPKMKTVLKTPVQGVTRISFDFIYSPALRKTGCLRTQVQIYSGNNLLVRDRAQKLISAVEQLSNGYVKETVSIWFNASGPVDSILLGVAGIWTDYKGPVFFDNMRLE